jgi:hypothetical protein
VEKGLRGNMHKGRKEMINVVDCKVRSLKGLKKVWTYGYVRYVRRGRLVAHIGLRGNKGMEGNYI